MAKFVLIGGRSTDFLADFSLEERCFSLLGYHNPSILYIPFAQNPEDSIAKFKKLTEKYTGEITYLNSVEDLALLEDAFWKADVIYFGGGSAERLVDFVRTSHLITCMKKYISSNKTFMGISAGAILFCAFGMGDQYAYKNANQFYNYKMVEGIGLLNITICPHYDHDGLWCYNDEVWKYGLDGYALEDDTAILFEDGVKVIKRVKSKSVYYFDKNKRGWMIPLYEVVR